MYCRTLKRDKKNFQVKKEIYPLPQKGIKMLKGIRTVLYGILSELKMDEEQLHGQFYWAFFVNHRKIIIVCFHLSLEHWPMPDYLKDLHICRLCENIYILLCFLRTNILIIFFFSECSSEFFGHAIFTLFLIKFKFCPSYFFTSIMPFI